MKPLHHIIILLFFTACSTTVFSQEKELVKKRRVFFEPQIGFSHLLKNSIDTELNNAFNFGLRFRFESASEKFSWAPTFNFRQFKHKEDYSDSNAYLLTLLKTGVQASFAIFESENKKVRMYNFCELNYTWSSYDYRYEDNSFRPDDVPNTDLFEIMSGKGPGLMLGYRLQLQYFFIEMGYDIFGANHVLSDEARDVLDSGGTAYDNEIEQGINSFNFHIGASIPLRFN
ncbi:hypothetical protein [Carboxylicivirga marina]|uniref:hypothetical protein n=1 Tax=Carboxylicivirga marina TaxID=2800988 RepID=UPI002597C49E|nr:hypothetical protein [uncultured Carboxylicivirga sp.]